MSDLYILINNELAGPFGLEDLQKMVTAGEIAADTLYAKEGASSWEQLSTIIEVPFAEGMDGKKQISPGEELRRCEQMSAALETVSTYAAAQEWKRNIAEEVKGLPASLRGFDDLIAAAVKKVSQERIRFQHQSFLKRAFGEHGAEQAAERRVSLLRQQRDQFAKVVEALRLKADLVPDSIAKRDLLVKELRLAIKELKAKKKEATVAMTEIRREARVASEGAGKTWLGFYDSSLAADQRRGIRHAKENALRPHEDAKELVEHQIMGIEEHLIWLERFA